MTNSFKIVVLLACATATTANGQMYESSRREPNFGIYAAETGGAMLGGLALGLPAALATFYLTYMDDVGPQMYKMLAVGVPFGVVGLAGGTTLAGSLFHQQGRFWPTLAWSAGSVAAGLGLVAGVYYLESNAVSIVSMDPVFLVAAIGLAAPPVLTTVGYNRSRPPDSYGSRFMPGSVGLASARDPEGIAHPMLDVRLLSVRF